MKAQLTDSQYRVAQLAAAGLTNKEIAARLFVTVKCVEWHLSHVYLRLQITSRSQIPRDVVPPPLPIDWTSRIDSLERRIIELERRTRPATRG